jgi:hypothetical protein
MKKRGIKRKASMLLTQEKIILSKQRIENTSQVDFDSTHTPKPTNNKNVVIAVINVEVRRILSKRFMVAYNS